MALIPSKSNLILIVLQLFFLKIRLFKTELKVKNEKRKHISLISQWYIQNQDLVGWYDIIIADKSKHTWRIISDGIRISSFDRNKEIVKMEMSASSEKVVKNNEEYFDSYADLEVHRLMLEDEERMKSYKTAIFSNKDYIKGKVIMDVGAGTGVLSIFCAMAEAKKVYAVEASTLAEIAQNVVKENQLDNIIQVIHNKVEDVELPNDEKVDIIVSEWMGFYLLHEGMLDSVIYARDKFLKTGGHMFPDSATIYMAPCSVPSMYELWENVHGIKMKTVADVLRKTKSNKPEVMEMRDGHLLCEKTALCWIDIQECAVDDLNFFTMRQVLGAVKDGNFQGICIWFDCRFPVLSGNNLEPSVMLCTSPSSPQTHWKQTVIVLPEEQIVEKGQPLSWELTMKRSIENNRRYDLQLVLLDPNEETHPIPCSCFMTKCIVIKEYLEQNALNDHEI